MSEKEKKIYPFSLEISGDKTAWGGESWKLADLGTVDSVIHTGPLKDNSLSEVMETYLDKVTGDEAYYLYGRQFPLMIRQLDVTSRTPLWVCPDDEIAAQRYDALGKKKMWFVAGASSDAEIYLGLKRKMAADEFYDRCLDSTIFGELNSLKVKEGDAFVIEPGVPHAAGPGVRIVEVAESSMLDFGISSSDGDEREMLAEVFDFVKLDAYAPVLSDRLHLAETQHFSVSRMNLEQALHINNGEDGGYSVYYCLAGSVSVQTPVEDESGGKRMENLILAAGEAAVVPADNADFFLVPSSSGTVLLEILGGKREILDSYTGEKVSGEGILQKDMSL